MMDDFGVNTHGWRIVFIFRFMFGSQTAAEHLVSDWFGICGGSNERCWKNLFPLRVKK